MIKHAWILTIFLVNSATAQPIGPGSSPGNAIPMAQLGLTDAGTFLQESFDSGYREIYPGGGIWYSFDLTGAQSGQQLLGSIATGSSFAATIEVLDSKLNNLGTLFGTATGALLPGSYYIHVTANTTTHYHFGVVSPPPLSNYPSKASHSSANPTELGSLVKVINPTNNFYTYYNRFDVVEMNTTQGSLMPDYSNPTPNPPNQIDFYRFELPETGPVKLIDQSNVLADEHSTFILAFNDSMVIWPANTTKTLTAGTYILEVVDARTVATGSGDTVATTRLQFENFQPYQFELLFNP
jgi:hypothetical protein